MCVCVRCCVLCSVVCVCVRACPCFYLCVRWAVRLSGCLSDCLFDYLSGCHVLFVHVVVFGVRACLFSLFCLFSVSCCCYVLSVLFCILVLSSSPRCGAAYFLSHWRGVSRDWAPVSCGACTDCHRRGHLVRYSPFFSISCIFDLGFAVSHICSHIGSHQALQKARS